MRVGQQLVVLESMKMEHVVVAECAGVVVSASRSPSARPSMSGDPLAVIDAREVGARCRSGVERVDRSRSRSPRSRRGARASRRRARSPPARRGRAPAGDATPHRARERRRSRRRRQLRRVRTAGRRRPAPAPLAAGAHRAHAGRRAGRRRRHGRRPLGRRDVVRLHRARRNAGHVEPREEGSAVRARRSACGSRSSSSPKAAADVRATPTARRSPGSTASRSTSSRSSAGSCRSSASRPVTASPATPRCSAAAT